MRKPKYADLADLPEDERIRIAAEYVARGQTVAVVVDDEAPKVARYQRKLIAHGCSIVATFKGPIAGAVTIKVGPRSP